MNYFLCVEWSKLKVYFFHIQIQSLQHYFFENIFLSLNQISFVALSKIKWLYSRKFISRLSILFYRFVDHIPVTHCNGYCSFTISFEVKCCKSSNFVIFLQNYFGCFKTFAFAYTFRPHKQEVTSTLNAQVRHLLTRDWEIKPIKIQGLANWWNFYGSMSRVC